MRRWGGGSRFDRRPITHATSTAAEYKKFQGGFKGSVIFRVICVKIFSRTSVLMLVVSAIHRLIEVVLSLEATRAAQRRQRRS
jgi:hypothetical protein